ncbi:acetate--CoA ligase family protein [Verticiella sediminum]|uniref:Acetate--CoA ligase family protein n=1 Tax=Verticiella sediminum TaxID=1247510 RepID=A0A556AYS6_9BURK|nr:acetate--CoA ligase family protein [Verticiella sediminum]TSH98092.1 acetate--CoA ligase family protein [Verticiella sediminum]
MSLPLAPLLDARSLVIVGASADPGRTGGMPVASLREAGFPAERLLLVNPKYDAIDGLACHPSIDALPFAPDLAVLAVRAADVLPTLERCHAIGIRAAVVFASGYAESGENDGARLQAELVAFARRSGMLVAGPNCIGFANNHTGVFATFIRHIARRREPGPIAIAAQSGNIAALLRNLGLDSGLRFSCIVSTGNEACVDLTDYLAHFAADPHTEAVVGYVEQIRRGPEFVRVALALRRAGKALFLLKVGSSAKGAEATVSHTAALAGRDVVYRTAFRQLGIASATDPHRLIDLVRLWRTGRRPAGRGACIVSLSGAACALMADHLARDGVAVPNSSPATQARLRAVVPTYGMVANPVDLTGQVTSDRSAFPAVLAAIAAADEFDAAVFYVMGELLDVMAPELLRAAAACEKLFIVIDTAEGATCHDALEAGGIVVFRDIHRASAALAGIVRWRADPAGRWEPGACRSGTAAVCARPEILRAARAGGRRQLTEVEAKALLAGSGLPMVSETLAHDADAAAAAAARLGWPVALKIVSPDIAHKSEIGGVRLGLADVAAVRDAHARLRADVARQRPEARIDGVVVQSQVVGGVPMLLGIVRDPIFGPVMTVGFGGVEAELDPDVAHRLLPVDAATADGMLAELRRSRLLDGFRGSPAADRAALVALMVALSDVMIALGDDIDELELNPVLVLPRGCGVVAVDALVRLSVPTTGGAAAAPREPA